MVSQVRWEDDIIWNADDVRYKVGKVGKYNIATFCVGAAVLKLLVFLIKYGIFSVFFSLYVIASCHIIELFESVIIHAILLR